MLAVGPNGPAERCENLAQTMVRPYDLMLALARPFCHTARHTDLGRTAIRLHNLFHGDGEATQLRTEVLCPHVDDLTAVQRVDFNPAATLLSTLALYLMRFLEATSKTAHENYTRR